MLEKQEECPKCSAHGKDWNYDGQICARCENEKRRKTKTINQLYEQIIESLEWMTKTPSVRTEAHKTLDNFKIYTEIMKK